MNDFQNFIMMITKTTSSFSKSLAANNGDTIVTVHSVKDIRARFDKDGNMISIETRLE